MSDLAQGARYASPLRYPGGKGKVANFMKMLVIENNFIGRDYVEVYAGGSSVGLSLLFEDYVDEIHINDLNLGIFSFWNAVLTETKSLCEMIRSLPVTVDEWYRQRAIYVEGLDGNIPSVELGFATFFLNRTNRSGIINGGVIGGLDQSGAWGIDARYNKDALIGRIRKIGRHRSRINLTRLDGAELLRSWATKSPEALFYLDPPYFVKGQGLYDNFYINSDHGEIAQIMAELPHPWVVSYDAAPEILSIYRKFEAVKYDLSYSAHKAALGREVMFFSNGLQVPDKMPAGVSPKEVSAARTLAYP